MDRMNSDYIKEKCDKHMIVSLLPNLLKKLVGNRLLRPSVTIVKYQLIT